MTRILYLEDSDIQAMGQMIDLAVKSTGASLVNNAFVLLNKLNAAEEIEVSEETPPAETEDESTNEEVS